MGAEAITTLGVVVALLVVHQVWWTNRQAVAAAQEQVEALERGWGAAEEGGGGAPVVGEGEGGGGGEDPFVVEGDSSGVVPSGGPVPGVSRAVPSAAPSVKPAPPGKAPARDEAYAVLRVPRLGLAVPVAQGVDKRAVLDKGYAGHYPGTAQPGARGNFALAGHRNTHGEPFRYLNRLREGDELLVDVRGRRYVYVVGKVLPETTAGDVGVIAPVPRSAVKPGYGYGEAGSYITLTTCTPEYTSKYRLVVWGALKTVVSVGR
ncbi:class E sortase [Streptomyces sp. NBC_00091]|uniref:class E sortase n=1 Tax=Streptomyces sp. NBC_00091 TaxID=2975648 RepID=UPI002B1D3A86|nr:class E sortase [Streptomyces sp. NBC_00091]